MPRKKTPSDAPPKPRPAPPRRVKDPQAREYLTPAEVEQLATAAAKLGRYGGRDALMIRTAFRHGLRGSELVGLRRDQVDLDTGVLHVRRLKGGTPSTHILAGWQVRQIRQLYRLIDSRFVFTTERGGAMCGGGFRKIVARAGKAAGLTFPVYPHMLRHATGYKLANEGRDTRSIQAYLGHANIQNTVRYTALASDRFKDFWED